LFFFPDSREDWEVTFKKFNLFNACVLFVIAICYNQGYMTLRWNYFDKEKADAEKLKLEEDKLYQEAIELAKIRVQD
jgi:hypothetical protein